jgi:hypothetical protein
MPGHLLGVLESSVVFQVDRDAGCPPGVTSDITSGLDLGSAWGKFVETVSPRQRGCPVRSGQSVAIGFKYGLPRRSDDASPTGRSGFGDAVLQGLTSN